MHTNGLVYKHTYSYICTQNKLISTQTHQLRIHVCMYEMISIKAHDFPLRANTCLVFSLGCIQVHSFHFDTGNTGKAIYILHMRVRTDTAVCDFTDGGGIRHAVRMRYTDMRTAGEYSTDTSYGFTYIVLTKNHVCAVHQKQLSCCDTNLK